MPHITDERKAELAEFLHPLEEAMPHCSPGDVTYIVCRLVAAYVTHGGTYEPRFDDLHDGLGVLAAAVSSWNGDILLPYEGMKRRENGNAYAGLFSAAFFAKLRTVNV